MPQKRVPGKHSHTSENARRAVCILSPKTLCFVVVVTLVIRIYIGVGFLSPASFNHHFSVSPSTPLLRNIYIYLKKNPQKVCTLIPKECGCSWPLSQNSGGELKKETLCQTL